MTWDTLKQKVAIKAIGQVESSLRYDAVNYGDPITVGIAQWYGSRAGAILLRMKTENPSKWTGVASSLDTDVSSKTGSWWDSRWLTRTEGDSIKLVLSNNAAIQGNQLVKDLEAYKTVAQNAGMNVEQNTDTFIMWAVAYHQGPKYAMQVLSAVGANASLDAMWRGCLNNAVLGGYPNRYNEAHEIIKNNDTSGVVDTGTAPPSPTQPPVAGNPNDGSGASNAISGNLGTITLLGDNTLRIQTDKGIVTAYPTTVDVWRVGSNNGGTVGSPVQPPSGDAPGQPSALRAAVVKWMTDHAGQFAYSQAPGRLDPVGSGYGDCSSIVYAAYKSIGIEIGTSTYTQKVQGTEIARGGGAMSDTDVAKLLPGDLICMYWSAGYEHVQMSMGGTQHIGHGGPGNGPTVSAQPITTYLTKTDWWTVRRFI